MIKNEHWKDKKLDFNSIRLTDNIARLLILTVKVEFHQSVSIKVPGCGHSVANLTVYIKGGDNCSLTNTKIRLKPDWKIYTETNSNIQTT